MVNLAYYLGRNWLGFSAIHETRQISGPADLLSLPDNADKNHPRACMFFFISVRLVVCIKAVISHPSRQMTQVKCEKFKILISRPRKIATWDLKRASCETSQRLTLKVSRALVKSEQIHFLIKSCYPSHETFSGRIFYPIKSSMFSFAATHMVEAIKWRDDWDRLSGNPINQQTCRVKCQEEETIHWDALSAYQFSH